MKLNALIFLFLCFIKLNAQESKIIGLLNDQLAKEMKMYEEDDSHMKILQPFQIDENKKLIFEFEKRVPYMDRWEIIRYEVSLNKIIGFVKDINVIFQTNENDVLVTVKTYDEERKMINTETSYSDLLFTEINREKNNSGFRDKILKAFKKAGYNINSEYWFD